MCRGNGTIIHANAGAAAARFGRRIFPSSQMSGNSKAPNRTDYFDFKTMVVTEIQSCVRGHVVVTIVSQQPLCT